jgi:hypothetical protein
MNKYATWIGQTNERKKYWRIMIWTKNPQWSVEKLAKYHEANEWMSRVENQISWASELNPQWNIRKSSKYDAKWGSQCMVVHFRNDETLDLNESMWWTCERLKII